MILEYFLSSCIFPITAGCSQEEGEKVRVSKQGTITHGLWGLQMFQKSTSVLQDWAECKKIQLSVAGGLCCQHQNQPWSHLRCGQILNFGRVASVWKLIWDFMAFSFLVLKVDCLCSLLPPTSIENTQQAYCLTKVMLQKLLYTCYKKTVKLVSLKYTFKYAGIFIVGKLNSKFIPE